MAVRNLILYYGVGWKHTLEEVHDKDAAVRERAFNTTPYIPPDVQSLIDAQALDVQLYDYAQVGPPSAFCALLCAACAACAACAERRATCASRRCWRRWTPWSTPWPRARARWG